MPMRLIQTIDAECCPRVLDAPLDDASAERLAGSLRVVADPARLRLLSLIGGAGEVCVCDLTETLGLSQPTVSHHLRVLTEAGLLEREQRGRWAFFRLLPEPIELLAGRIGDTGLRKLRLTRRAAAEFIGAGLGLAALRMLFSSIGSRTHHD
jgi:ArsR family transcriptional regulator